MGLLDILGKIVLDFVAKKAEGQTEVSVEIPLGQNKPEDPVKEQIGIDWSNTTDHVTEHFTVGDALTLHGWNRLATEVDGAYFEKLMVLCKKMEEIRTILGCPVKIHCMYRSSAYNQSQNIKPNADVHSMNLACDFDCNPNMTIDEVKNKLEPLLEQLGIRMEKGTSSWIHIDLRQPGPSGRYFTA